MIANLRDRQIDRQPVMGPPIKGTHLLILKGCSIAQKIVIEIVIEICMEQTRLFLCNRFHCAENRQSGQNRFFREVGGAYEYLCRARAVHDVISSTCSLLRLVRVLLRYGALEIVSVIIIIIIISCIHIFVIVIYVHYCRLLSKTFHL